MYRIESACTPVAFCVTIDVDVCLVPNIMNKRVRAHVTACPCCASVYVCVCVSLCVCACASRGRTQPYLDKHGDQQSENAAACDATTKGDASERSGHQESASARRRHRRVRERRWHGAATRRHEEQDGEAPCTCRDWWASTNRRPVNAHSGSRKSHRRSRLQALRRACALLEFPTGSLAGPPAAKEHDKAKSRDSEVFPAVKGGQNGEY